jgi:hypothetical protein
MKTIPLLLLCLFASCSRGSGEGQEILHSLNATKQKQKIGWLKKKLEIAERGRQQIEVELENLTVEIHQATLSLIRKQLDGYEKQLAELLASPQRSAQLKHTEIGRLFLQEREALHEIIQDGPSAAAFDAQTELDRILRMITQLSEKKEQKNDIL